MADDATFNFWHTLPLRQVFHPTGITYQGYLGIWWPSYFGRYFVPVSEIEYFSTLMSVFYEAKVFHEIAISKFLYTVKYSRYLHPNDTKFNVQFDMITMLYNKVLPVSLQIGHERFTRQIHYDLLLSRKCENYHK
ncbi:unnamed protein product [Heligmosomoides polygyrus]|uniref:Transmembrane protein 231 n=1 Tax=Heligmosomoides polygyrus TaxID=6339 RepID=A0A183FH92_HELPZ|nr:unnamed protein product [Heligmosomoides polygyrus]